MGGVKEELLQERVGIHVHYTVYNAWLVSVRIQPTITKNTKQYHNLVLTYPGMVSRHTGCRDIWQASDMKLTIPTEYPQEVKSTAGVKSTMVNSYLGVNSAV